MAPDVPSVRLESLTYDGLPRPSWRHPDTRRLWKAIVQSLLTPYELPRWSSFSWCVGDAWISAEAMVFGSSGRADRRWLDGGQLRARRAGTRFLRIGEPSVDHCHRLVPDDLQSGQPPAQSVFSNAGAGGLGVGAELRLHSTSGLVADGGAANRGFCVRPDDRVLRSLHSGCGLGVDAQGTRQ